MFLNSKVIESRNLDAVHKSLEQLKIPNIAKNCRSDYEELFYDHLFRLFKVELMNYKAISRSLWYNHATYYGWEQYLFEFPETVEMIPEQLYDRDFASDARDIFDNWLKKLTGIDKTAQEPGCSLREFTGNCFEHWITYQIMYPESVSNPWVPALSIFQKGYLLRVANNNEKIVEHFGMAIKPVDGGKARLVLMTQTLFGGDKQAFEVDNRHVFQLLAFDFIKNHAPGTAHATSLSNIKNFLLEQKIEYSAGKIDEKFVKNKVLAPLLKYALIGSNEAGYFLNPAKSKQVLPFQKMEDN